MVLIICPPIVLTHTINDAIICILIAISSSIG